MTDFRKLEFHIYDKDLNIISAKDLVDIMTPVINAFGNYENVHWVDGVRDGCVAVALRFDAHIYEKAINDFQQSDYIEKINDKLIEHNAYAKLKTDKSEGNQAEIYDFLGIKNYKKEKFLEIYSSRTIKGKVVSISGVDNSANIQIVGLNGKKYKCVADATDAIKLHWGQYVSAETEGTWIRTEDGKWEIPNYGKLKIKEIKTIQIQSTQYVFKKLGGLISEDIFNEIQENLKN